MLKLKHLFYNEELAETLIKNWTFTHQSLDLFKYYRISSNATYPFQADGQTLFIRFSPTEEKREDQIEAELAVIQTSWITILSKKSRINYIVVKCFYAKKVTEFCSNSVTS